MKIDDEPTFTAGKYILDEHGNPKQEPDLLKWAAWYERTDRHVGWDEITEGVKVSTVFLGIDQNFGANGPPILWETMIFGGIHDQWMDRYTTRNAAIQGHNHAVQLARSALRPIRVNDSVQ